jgi:TRAP-type transport system small permease protein
LKSALALLDRAVEAALAIVRVFCIAFAAGIFAVVIYAVFARYVLTQLPFFAGRVPSWTEEVPRYFLIWISFLGAAACIARREHVAFDVLFMRFPERTRRFLGAFIALLMMGFGWIVFRYGITFVDDFGSDLMETIPFTNYWYYTAAPISGALMMLFALKLAADSLRGIGDGTGSSVD